MKRMLQNGQSVQYRSSGNSLRPLVYSGDCCILVPVWDPALLVPYDVVFCEVQPGNRFYTHYILRIEWETAAASSAATGEPKRKFIIGNARHHENGYCYDEHIYGRLVEVYH